MHLHEKVGDSHRLLKAALFLALAAAALPADFSGERAMAHARRAVGFGPRPSGSEAIGKLRAYIIAELRNSGAQVTEDRFMAPTPAGPIPMSNIIGRFPGTSGQAIAVTGHYDTKRLPGFVGANDGGSSTAILLELARASRDTPRTADLLIVFFDGEEAVQDWSPQDSLYGSRRLAARFASENRLSKIQALINVDMTGDRNLNILDDLNSSPRLRRLARDVARDLGLTRFFSAAPSAIEDDHLPFVERGIEALDLIDFDYGPANRFWHTNDDTLDKLSPSSLEITGRLVLELVRRLGTPVQQGGAKIA